MLAAADELIRFTKRMENAGVPVHHAQEQSAAIVDLVTSLHNANKPVTQEDLFKVETRLETRIAGVESRLELKIAALDTKLSDTKADIIKWMIGQTIAVLLAIFGMLHGMAK